MAQAPVRGLQADINRFQGPIVTITVGRREERFYVHESLICASSLFFNRALSGQWKESEEHTVALPEDDPRIFALYTHWLYAGQIPVIVPCPTMNEAGVNNTREQFHLAKAYVLGDKLLDVEFQNSTIQAIVEKADTNGFSRYPDSRSISYAYDNTTESAKIRKLFVDIYVEILPRKLNKGFPEEFLYSVVEGLMKKRLSPPRPIEASNYFLDPSGS
ncbi:hypothetical protein N7516_001493 [Penicillium verrucosum]|uniref:uncharacterized protein n=1 Tax=Penicillium verrucosum TaxID=60171 RepID=UPI0025455799|nr:uncharacterized protein N7516_001493 [Penicillium verrucosum]KAJ5941325.1 hypothetical protein N7516_001493 [Penicillium verrucosum]